MLHLAYFPASFPFIMSVTCGNIQHGKVSILVCMLVAASGFGLAVGLLTSCTCNMLPPLQLNAGAHCGIVRHVHQHHAKVLITAQHPGPCNDTAWFGSAHLLDQQVWGRVMLDHPHVAGHQPVLGVKEHVLLPCVAVQATHILRTHRTHQQ